MSYKNLSQEMTVVVAAKLQLIQLEAVLGTPLFEALVDAALANDTQTVRSLLTCQATRAAAQEFADEVMS